MDLRFEAEVKKHGDKIPTGRITHQKLIPLIGKKVNVKIRKVEA